MDNIDGFTTSRDGNTTTLECIKNGLTSTYYCDGMSWIGQMPNCSTEQEHHEMDSDPIEYKGKYENDIHNSALSGQNDIQSMKKT